MDVDKFKSSYDLKNVSPDAVRPHIKSRYLDGTKTLVINDPSSSEAEHLLPQWFLQTTEDFMDPSFPFEKLVAFSILGFACEAEREKMQHIVDAQKAGLYLDKILQDPERYLSKKSLQMRPLHKGLNPKGYSRTYMRSRGIKEAQSWMTHCRRYVIAQDSQTKLWRADISDFLVGVFALSALMLVKKGVPMENWSKAMLQDQAKTLWMAAEEAGEHQKLSEAVETLELVLTSHGLME